MPSLGEEQLQQIFSCCDPALDRDDQVALVLHTVCGLTFAQVARALLLPTTTIARRLMKARKRLRESASNSAGEDPRWEERLGAAMTALYLMFNEGYAATDGSSLIREDLCTAAIQLARLLRKRFAQPPPELDSLLALMLLHE